MSSINNSNCTQSTTRKRLMQMVRPPCYGRWGGWPKVGGFLFWLNPRCGRRVSKQGVWIKVCNMKFPEVNPDFRF